MKDMKVNVPTSLEDVKRVSVGLFNKLDNIIVKLAVEAADKVGEVVTNIAEKKTDEVAPCPCTDKVHLEKEDTETVEIWACSKCGKTHEVKKEG